MVAPLRRVLVKRPDEAFGAADPDHWHYTARPLLDAARREHDALVEILREDGCEIIYHDSAPPDCADAIFTHDPAIVTDAGAIILGMGKPARADEPAALARMFSKLGVPILASLRGEARAEGGDLLWLDPETLAVGLGERTNKTGLHQLEQALEPLGVALVPVPLPELDDPLACLHLMSCISLVDDDLAVVFLPLLPGRFVRLLEQRGCRFVEVPEQELATMGPNVLAVGPRDCVMLQGNPITQRRLRSAGCRVRTYAGDEISLKAEGGATCLTRPILREV
jgi:N-dimethylarginine dimethylaminohydrolase